MLDEVIAGEVCLNEDGQELTRVINGLGLDVFVQVDDVRYQLTEARQEFPDGSIRVRDLSTSLGEKIKAGEGIEQVIARALMEELGIDLHEAVGYGVGKTEAHQRESGSFPGLKTVVVLTHAAVELSPEQYCLEGYVEVQDSKQTKFEWRVVQD